MLKQIIEINKILRHKIYNKNKLLAINPKTLCIEKHLNRNIISNYLIKGEVNKISENYEVL
jgi:hypothetical protein